MRTVLQLTGIGWYIVLTIAGGVVGGWWLDNLWVTNPVFTLIGLGAGIIVAVAGMYRMLMEVIASGPDDKGPGD